MQKIRSLMWHWLLTAVTGAGFFFFCVMHAHAGEISGNEVHFTHTHSGNCYETVTLSCEGSHRCDHRMEYGTYHCIRCNAQTTHYIVTDNYICPVKGVSWQQNSYTGCNICGTRHSEWSSGAPGDHIYTEQRLKCGLQAGEATSAIKIMADDTWTNTGVTLYAKTNLLKQDSINESISYDWSNGSMHVTENGTYSVTAKNGTGNTVTASISINCIDKISPVISSVNGDTGGMTGERITVSVNADDGESGLASEAFSFDGGATWTASASFSLEEGKEISLVVRDKAGNVTGRTVKRSDFPYPPKPTPAPVPTSKPAPVSVPTLIQPPTEQNVSDTVQTPAGQGQTEPARQAGKDISETVQSPKEQTTAKPSPRIEKAPKSDNGSATDTEEKKMQNNLSALEQAGKNMKTENRNGQKNIIISRMEKAAVAQNGGIHNTRQDGMHTGQNNQKKGRKISGTPVSAEDGMQTDTADKAQKPGLVQHFMAYSKNNGWFITGVFLIVGALFMMMRLVWLHSVELYCYNGGDEFRKLGLLHLKKEKNAFALYLPDYLLETAGTPRYRLMVKSRLVKKWRKTDLVVRSDEHKLRQPLEECIDFVL